MTNFDVHINKSPSANKYPYLINVQAPILNELATRVVVPLISKQLLDGYTLRTLNFEIVVDRISYVAVTQQMTAIPKEFLGNKVENIEIDRGRMLSAIDFLITGY